MSDIEIREFCVHCNKTQPTKRIDHSSGIEIVCCVCLRQIDFLHDDEDDDFQEFDDEDDDYEY